MLISLCNNSNIFSLSGVCAAPSTPSALRTLAAFKPEANLPATKSAFALAAFALGKSDPVLYFIQRMRDEAHNFVIGTHRSKRSKTISANPLDDIPGVGVSRKRALLDHFGSSKRIKSAHLTDLKSVDGISSGLAERIYNHFNDT